MSGFIFAAGVILSMFCFAAPAKAGTIPAPEKDFPATSSQNTIVLAGGCFWCTEAVFRTVKGVEAVVSGYAGGAKADGTYDKVSTGNTGHAEAVKITYDPEKVSLGRILQIFFSVAHDPTQLNRQGNDVGTQYRSAVFSQDEETRQYVADYIAQLDAAKVFSKPIVTTIENSDKFYAAEKYHQDYAARNPENPYIKGVSDPKVEKLKTLYSEMKKGNLSKMQRYVTQENGTEPAFRNEFWDNHEDGIYVDVQSGEALFSSTDKFDSGTGWPSFVRPIEKKNIIEKRDDSHGMTRVEVRSVKGNSHLGHLFTDGPEDKGGLRYCINSASLRFIPKENLNEEGYGGYIPLFEK